VAPSGKLLTQRGMAQRSRKERFRQAGGIERVTPPIPIDPGHFEPVGHGRRVHREGERSAATSPPRGERKDDAHQPARDAMQE
jgi:hypothetical protein